MNNIIYAIGAAKPVKVSGSTECSGASRALILAAGGLVACIALSGTAQAGADIALKDAAILGTLASWGVATLRQDPAGICLTRGNWSMRGQSGHDKELDLASLAAVRRDCRLTGASGWQLDVEPMFSISRWRASSGVSSAWDFAFVPMMHWKHPLGADLRVYVEFGIGPAWLSKANIGNRHKSTNFQLSDHLGLGLGSADGHWRVGFAYRHISNAGIRSPNNAVDFKGLSLEWRP